MIFLTELRKAHAVFVAFQRGDKSVSAICHRTGLSCSTVAEWCSLLKLPVYWPSQTDLAKAAKLEFDI